MVSTYYPFQAVVLAGGLGNRMMSVTEHVQKALLPIGNIPLFWYPLHVLAENKFHKVLLIANDENSDQIRESLNDGSLPDLPGLEIEVVSPGVQDQDDWGTADVLRHFSNKITSDFIFMGADFVSDINLRNMIEFHQSRKSILTTLLSNQACNSTAPGDKELQKHRDFSAVSATDGRLVYLQPEEDLDGNEIELDPHLLKRISNVELSANHVDCHVYIMDKRILTFLEWERDLSSVKADLIPFLVEKQNLKDDVELCSLFQNQELTDYAFELRHGVDKEPPEGFQLFAYRSTRDAVSIIAKCNTLGAYLETNKVILDQNPLFIPDFEAIKYPGQKVHVIKSRIHESTKVGDANLKVVSSSVGKNCVIENNTKVEGSIIMNNVKIGAGAKINKCIVLEGVTIGENASLEMCVVDKDHNLEAGTTAKQEHIRTEVEMNIEDY